MAEHEALSSKQDPSRENKWLSLVTCVPDEARLNAHVQFIEPVKGQKDQKFVQLNVTVWPDLTTLQSDRAFWFD